MNTIQVDNFRVLLQLIEILVHYLHAMTVSEGILEISIVSDDKLRVLSVTDWIFNLLYLSIRLFQKILMQSWYTVVEISIVSAMQAYNFRILPATDWNFNPLPTCHDCSRRYVSLFTQPLFSVTDWIFNPLPIYQAVPEDIYAILIHSRWNFNSERYAGL